MLRAVLGNLFTTIGGGKGLFPSRVQSPPKVAKEIVVLSPGEIPTTDIYLRGQLERQYGKEVRYVDTLRSAPEEIALGDSMIVIVRHAPLRWLRWLEHNRGQLNGVVFLMDDDIPAAATAVELPFRYAMKTAWRYARARRLLGRLCSEVWVSTPELARRYKDASPKLWEPVYVGRLSTNRALAPVYFYHGSWAHHQEIEWLLPIVKRIQDAFPDVWFEIIGTDRVKHLFRGIPRVRIVHPMSWKDYLAYAGTVRYQVGLAPCFDTDFNRARSHSKMFDITRLGAAGIYSNITPYAEKVVDGKTGLLCDNDPDRWVDALTLLLSDSVLRSSLYSEAREWCDVCRSCNSL
jgi:glycosyltransferase involved in cell wall biosynthesis